MGGKGGAPAPCVFQRLRQVGQELDGELAQLVPRAGLTSTQTNAVIPAGTLLPSRSRSLKAEFRRHTSLPSSPLPSHGAPPENYMIEHQWFDSLQVHFAVHLREVILLIINDLPVERCTSTVGEERNWRRISEGEARPGVFEGAEPLHQAPSGAARSAGGRTGGSRRSLRLCAERTNKEARSSFDDRASKERRLPTLPTGGSVPSAMVSLTSLFGMGRGGSSPL